MSAASRQSGDAPHEAQPARGAFIGVDAQGLSGWMWCAAASAEIRLMHGDVELLSYSVEPRLDRGGDADGAPAQERFSFALGAAAAAARRSDVTTAPLRVVLDGEYLPGATPPLSADDLSLLTAISQAAANPPAPPPVSPLRGGAAALGRLAAGLKRNGPGRVLAFARTMMAREGLAGAVKFALLSRPQRQQWLIERRRAHHSAIDAVIAPARLELQERPPAAHPFETAIFRDWPCDANSETPLIGYQRFALARLRYPGALNTDAERKAALIWYVETYSPFRRPFKVPFSGGQIAWLLTSVEAGARGPLPRIVDWFLQARTAEGDARDAPWSPARIAYWWCVQKAVDLNIEHVLLPESFIARLSAPSGDDAGAAPPCEFLTQHFVLEPSFVPNLETSAGRFEAYVRLLMSDGGLHFSLFMPDGVLERIARLGALAAPDVQARFDGPRVSARAREALDHRRACAHIRDSGADLSAARLSQDWVAAAADADATAKAPAPRVSGSALPFAVRVIGPLNSRSGLGQAARLSIASLQAVGVAVETVDFLLDNPAPRGGYIPNAFDLSPGFGVNLLHLSGESLPLAAAFMAPEFFTGRANIGYFFWELPHPAECHELALEQLDELWVASSFNRDIYAPYLPDSVFRVGMALEPVSAALDGRAETRRRFGLPQTAFIFVTTFDAFSFISRKNPSASIRAFLKAFPLGSEDVRLIVKTHNLTRSLGEVRADALRAEILQLCASDPRILLINETLSHTDLLTLKSACDVYVSLHRSEGWGFGMVESMQLGLPVIATGFSGNLDFCTEETSWLVDHQKVRLDPDEYIFVRPDDYWAEPDLASAARCMRLAAADPVATAAKGAAAQRFVQARFSPASVGSVYLERLRAVARRWGAAAPRSASSVA